MDRQPKALRRPDLHNQSACPSTLSSGRRDDETPRTPPQGIDTPRKHTEPYGRDASSQRLAARPEQMFAVSSPWSAVTPLQRSIAMLEAVAHSDG